MKSDLFVAGERDSAVARFHGVFPREPAMKRAAIFIAFLVLSAPAVAAEDFAPVALNSLSATPAKIVAAPVLDQNGTVIGKVRAVATDQDGKPSALSYLAGNQVLVVAAPAVSYDAQKNRVIADVAKAQLGQQVAVN